MSPPSHAPAEMFEALLCEHRAALGRLCAGYEHRAARREELFQEISLQLWRALASFRGEASLRTWMFRVAHNTAISYASRRPPAQEGEDGLLEIPDRADPPDEALDRARAVARMQRAIQALGAIDRQVILLYLEEIPQAEIAEVTGLSRDNVSTRVGRIKAALAAALGRPGAADHRRAS